MRTSQKIFLRRLDQRGHDETIVHIDWEGVSEHDIRLMASYYVLHRVEDELKCWDRKLPESVEYQAAAFIHNEPLLSKPFDIPFNKKQQHTTAYNKFKELLQGLSKEEVAILLKD